ncbi:MAG: lipoyl(octanoyl) transferase LipB [Myxococcota bacterium]
MIVRLAGVLSYAAGLEQQHRARERVLAGGPDELLLLEHQPVVTLGRRGGVVDSARLAELGIPTVQTDRGGLATWHGPGQLTGYPIVDLRRRRLAVGDFVATLGRLLEALSAEFGVDARWERERPGVYVGAKKLGSIGLHVHRGVTTHGFALNVDCDLAGFAAISPCGATDLAMTTLAREADRPPTLAQVRDAAASQFTRPWPVVTTGA